MKIMPIKDPIYHANISILTNYTGEEIRRYFNNKYHVGHDFKENGGHTWATHFSVVNKDNSDVRHYICVQKFEWTVSQQCLLIHELYHLACSILRDDIHVLQCAETDEVYAYYLQYLVNNIFLALLKDGKLLEKVGLKLDKKKR